MVKEVTERTILLERINEIDKISDQEWKAGLAGRKLKELEFHDRDRDQSRVEKTISSDTYEKILWKQEVLSGYQALKAVCQKLGSHREQG